jgi:hypothetical protein
VRLAAFRLKTTLRSAAYAALLAGAWESSHDALHALSVPDSCSWTSITLRRVQPQLAPRRADPPEEIAAFTLVDDEPGDVADFDARHRPRTSPPGSICLPLESRIFTVLAPSLADQPPEMGDWMLSARAGPPTSAAASFHINYMTNILC